jgi:glycosyltransferase involved in cell wall biosynthesis
MLRVCHVISGDLWAGAEVMGYHLIKKLIKYDDLELSVLLLNDNKLATEIRRLGIPVDIVDETRKNFFFLILAARKILERRSPHIIHSHRYKENMLAFLSAKSQNGTQLVSTQHGMPEAGGRNLNIKYFLLGKLNIRLLSKSFKKLVVVSDDMRNILIHKHAFPEGKIIVIHNGTEIPVRQSSKKENNQFVIGTMGRIVPVKDYSLMVEIAKEVHRETDKIRFVLAGDGPDREKIMDLIKQYRLEKVFQLRGFVENTSHFYHGLDLYLNTSLHEGIPMSVLEAMSYEIPIVAPNEGGLKEIISDGFEGYLVEGRDPKVFADKCLHIYEDKLLRQTMGSNCRRKIEAEFSIDHMAREYCRLYHDIAI